MPPNLALLIGFAFVFWALRWESRVHPYPTGSLWLPTLWMMRCASRSIDAWHNGYDIGRWDPVFIAFLMFLGMRVLARRPCNWGQIVSHNSALFLFYGYIVLSLAWADSLESPFIKLFRPAGDLVMALVIATEPSPVRAMVTMFRRTAIALIPLSLVLIRYFHDLGTGQDKHWGADYWIGVSTHKNPLGQLCIVSALGFLWTIVDARRRGQSLFSQRMALFYLALTLLIFSGGGNANSRSSTSIMCLMIAVGVFIGVGRLRAQIQGVMRKIVLVGIGIGLLAGALQISGTSLQAVVAESFGKNATLSDRTYLWDDVIRIGLKHPIIGTGYGGFWIPSLYPQLSPKVDNGPAEAHNGYLETFANLGLIGVLLLVCVISQSLSSATDLIRTDFEYGRIRLLLIFMVLVMNYSEATFPRGTHLWWFGFLIVAVYARPWVNWPEEEEEEAEEETGAEVSDETEATQETAWT